MGSLCDGPDPHRPVELGAIVVFLLDKSFIGGLFAFEGLFVLFGDLMFEAIMGFTGFGCDMR